MRIKNLSVEEIDSAIMLLGIFLLSIMDIVFRF